MLSLILSIFFLIPFSFNMSLYVLILFLFILNFYFIFFFGFYDFFSYVSLNMGLDKYSFYMIMLTFWLMILMTYSSLNLNKLYFSYLKLMIFIMVFFLLVCFISLDYFTFYIYFECSVLPVFILIYGWGYQPERVFSSLYFFFYTLFSSLPLFLSILSLNSSLGFFYFGVEFVSGNFYLFFFFIFSFLVSLPMFFFHLWLPKAHVEAPLAGSMILAGVLLKLGGYGLIRVSFMFLSLLNLYSFIFISVSLMGSFYVSLFCFLQADLKVLVAYSSVSHMGLVLSGVMSLSSYGYMGSLYLMVSHGLVSSGLFYLVGCLYDRLGSRSLFLMSGLLSFSPSMVMFFFLLIVSNMSCPPSLNLVSEVFICFSLIKWHCLTLVYIFLSLFFSACAMISFFSYISHGVNSGLLKSMDLGLVREFFVMTMHLVPLYMFVLNLDFFI
uniref:NADH-ubiquinone oxidoreductase chain 4 n=1 Tax=Chloriona tateyamana TaxID=2566016 RepID=A0A7S4YYP3_9HEMI|nr:NADH dehydrogenase subunit 4 [Chloriona tateyamana]QBZ37986.1 NADH dehydrogenase subunit 4 [Chloriona tateyamana]